MVSIMKKLNQYTILILAMACNAKTSKTTSTSTPTTDVSTSADSTSTTTESSATTKPDSTTTESTTTSTTPSSNLNVIQNSNNPNSGIITTNVGDEVQTIIALPFDVRLKATPALQYARSGVETQLEGCMNNYLQQGKFSITNSNASVQLVSLSNSISSCMSQTPLKSSGGGKYDYSGKFSIHFQCQGSDLMELNSLSLIDQAFTVKFCSKGTSGNIDYSVEIVSNEWDQAGNKVRSYHRTKTLLSTDTSNTCGFSVVSGAYKFFNSCIWKDVIQDTSGKEIHTVVLQPQNLVSQVATANTTTSSVVDNASGTTVIASTTPGNTGTTSTTVTTTPGTTTTTIPATTTTSSSTSNTVNIGSLLQQVFTGGNINVIMDGTQSTISFQNGGTVIPVSKDLQYVYPQVISILNSGAIQFNPAATSSTISINGTGTLTNSSGGTTTGTINATGTINTNGTTTSGAQ